MIERIDIAGVATFGTAPSVMDGLSQFNYVYGANGSGKTTISRIIADQAAHPSCRVGWNTGAPLETLVYNRDFVEKHFRASHELPGIFTLGEKNADVLDKITQAKKDVDKLTDEIARLTTTLQGSDGTGGKLGELVVVEDTFKDACWEQKREHDEDLKMAFEGFRNNAERFKERVLAEHKTNTADSKTLADIMVNASTVFSEDVERVLHIPPIDAGSLLECEQSPILAKRVIGKSDVNIAAMIERLKNSDWVRAGRAYYEVNNEKCPFCQQAVTSGFAEKLQAYFDETFEADTQLIAELVADYATESSTVTFALEQILAGAPAQLDASDLTERIKLLKSRLEINRQRLLEKQKEPSRAIAMESTADVIHEIDRYVTSANERIADHNRTVANLSEEREVLKAQVWRYLLDVPLKKAVETYESKKSDLDKAITNLRLQIRTKETEKRAKEQEIAKLERDVTSIRPTIDAINGLLKSFGFNGFSLAQADGRLCYKLVRDDGTDAKETLSEGEKTFITFIYFYHLLKGSSSESGVTSNRVVVFDDPVSSLDSDILFIVSTLIRKVCEEVRAGTTNLKQVFLMTHNVYFHKEVTFQKSRVRGTLNDETFWTVRKSRGESAIVNHLSNPIKSSYELLWMEVREAKPGDLSLQNSMRRILETYFKMLGGIDLDKIHDRFEGNEKLACRALLSWVNDGSHSAHDDLYVAVDETTVELYLKVFRRIFESEGHIGHYNMMMVEPSGPIGLIE